jgi:DNA-binding SARP family transcriptional activator
MIRLLGPLEWLRPSASLVPASRRASAVFGWLVFREGLPIEREVIATTLWPESGARQASVNLRRVLSDLRDWLGSDAWRLASPTKATLRFDLGEITTDVREVRAAARRCVHAWDPAVAISGLEYYRGSLLESFDLPWLSGEREQLAQSVLRLALVTAQEALRLGRIESALELAKRAERIDPLNEDVQYLLYEVLSAHGNPRAVRQSLRTFQQRLRRELGIDASDELTTFAQNLATAPPVDDSTLLERLSCFVPDFLPDVGSRVCEIGMHRLGHLVERGQISVDVRWRLTSPASVPETAFNDELRARFVAHYAILSDKIATGLWSTNFNDALLLARSEEQNLRRALSWATDPSDWSEILFQGLLQLWDYERNITAGLECTQRILDMPPFPDNKEFLRGVRGWHATFQSYQGNHVRARQELETILQDPTIDDNQVVPVLLGLGYACQHLGDSKAAEVHYRQMLSLCQKNGWTGWELQALSLLGLALAAMGKHEEALRIAQQAILIAQETKNVQGEIDARTCLAEVYEVQQSFELSELEWEEVLEFASRSGSNKYARRALEALERLAIVQGRSHHARRFRRRLDTFSNGI